MSNLYATKVTGKLLKFLSYFYILKSFKSTFDSGYRQLLFFFLLVIGFFCFQYTYTRIYQVFLFPGKLDEAE